MIHEGLAEELVKLAEHLVGGYGILFVAAFVTFVFRDFVTNFASGVRTFGLSFEGNLANSLPADVFECDNDAKIYNLMKLNALELLVLVALGIISSMIYYQ